MPGENMADKQKTIEIIFGGVDKTGGAISSVGRNLDSLTGRVGDLTGPLANITDSIVKLDLALAAAAAGVTGYAIKIADDFDTAFGEIATLIGQPADNLRDFQAQILEYSERSTQSLDQITSATYGAISAGVEYQNSLELIAAAEQLSIAGRADLGSTTTALVSTLNAFGASAEEAGDYADDFFTIVQLGQTTIPELSSTIGRLAPIAASAGLSFEEMGAAIATITASTGTSTAEAITGIRSAVQSLIKPVPAATKLAEELGIEFNAAALESKGFAGVIKDVAEATGGSTELIGQLFTNTEALTPVLALAGNASDDFAKNLKAFEDNAGASENAAAELNNTLSALGQTLQNNLNSALIGLGSNLTDETRSIVQSITAIFNSIGSEIRLEDGVFAPILSGLEGLAQDIDQKLQTIAANFPEALAGIDLSDLLSAFGDLGDELGDLFTGLFGDVDLSTVEGLKDVLQQVVDAFTALVNVSAGIANGLEPLFQAIGEGIEQFQNLDDETKKTAGEFLGLAKAIDTVLPVVGGLATGLDSIGTGLTALAGAQGFKALIGNLETVKGIAGAAGKFGLVGTILLGKAGIAGGIGYGIGTIIQKGVIEPIEELVGQSVGGALYELINAEEIALAEAKFQGLNDEIRRGAEDARNLAEAKASLGRSLDNTKDSAELNIEAINRDIAAMIEAKQKTDALSESQRGISNAVEELNQKVSSSGGALGEVSKTTQQLAENNKSLQLGYDETTGKINSFSGTIVNSNKALDDAAKKTEEVVKQTEAYQLKLLELSSNERIKQIEAKVSLDIAEVEAGAKKVEAIAKTISDTFINTGDVISELFGGFDDASRSTQIDLSKQIRQENEFRQQALDDQSQLTQAQVDLIRERTRQLARGDSLIKVDGAGLQPHLEAFMFEILREIQVRVNADGEEMLLGLN